MGSEDCTDISRVLINALNEIALLNQKVEEQKLIIEKLEERVTELIDRLSQDD